MAEQNTLALIKEFAEQERWGEASGLCQNCFSLGRITLKNLSLEEQEELTLLTISCSIMAAELQHALTDSALVFLKDIIGSLKDPLLSLTKDTAEREEKFQKYLESTALAAQQKYYSKMDELIYSMDISYNVSLGIYTSTGTFFSYRGGYNDLYDYFINPGFSELAKAANLSYTETSHRMEAMHVTGDKLFEKATSYVEKINSEASDFPYFFNLDVAEMYFAATHFLGHSIDAAANSNVKFERSKLCVNLYCDLLNAILVRNGTKTSLVFEEKLRKSCFDSLLYYEEICQKIDKTFSHPPVNKEKVSPLSNQNSSGGCYVATAVYGSYDCPEVWTLRRFRDYTLAETWYGRAFIKAYYAISPTLVKWFGHTAWFKKMWKGKLDRMIAALQEKGTESTPYEDKEWK